MVLVEHRLEGGALGDILVLLEHPVDPAGDRDAVAVHGLSVVVLGLVEAPLEPLVVDVPDSRPVLPGPLGQAVVGRQGAGVEAQVGGALDVVVAAQDIGAAAGLADIAQRQLQDAVGPGVVVAGGVLGAAHAPDDAAGLPGGQALGHVTHGGLGNAGDILDDRGGVAGHLGAHLVHAVDPLLDILAVLPAVLEDVPQEAPDKGHIGAGANAHMGIGLGRGAGEARVGDDDIAVVALLGDQEVLHGHRVRLGGVGADEEDRATVVHVVERVGHRSVTPGVGDPGHGGGVADARLVVGVVGPPEGGELAQQVGLLVAELGRAEPEDAVGTVGLAQGEHLVADLLDGVVPAHALPLATHQLHGVLETPAGLAVLPEGSPLGAVGAAVDGMVEGGLLAGPDALLDLGIGAAAYRAVGADGALHLEIGRAHV